MPITQSAKKAVRGSLRKKSFNDSRKRAMKAIIKKIERLSGKSYKGNERTMRIIADHIKASVFIISEGISPSNTGQGYVLRRLIRKAVYYGREMNIKNISKIAEPVFKIYDDYSELKKNKKKIIEEIDKEEERFNKTLKSGLKKIDKLSIKINISGKDAFLIYQSHGLPIELIIERAEKRGSDIDIKEFQKELKKHQALSKKSTKGKFSSGLADNSKQTTKLHTATHLLNQA